MRNVNVVTVLLVVVLILMIFLLVGHQVTIN